MVRIGAFSVETELEELSGKSAQELADMIHPDMRRDDGYAVIHGDDPKVYRIVSAKALYEEAGARSAASNRARKPAPARKRKKTPASQKQPAPAAPRKKKGGCSRKHCRLGDRECDQYWGCRDTCRVVSQRITAMDACPEPEA